MYLMNMIDRIFGHCWWDPTRCWFSSRSWFSSGSSRPRFSCQDGETSFKCDHDNLDNIDHIDHIDNIDNIDHIDYIDHIDRLVPGEGRWSPLVPPPQPSLCQSYFSFFLRFLLLLSIIIHYNNHQRVHHHAHHGQPLISDLTNCNVSGL